VTDVQLAYLAGFIDGEGSIGIVSIAKHKRYVTQIAAYNTNPVPIELLSRLFGGKVRLRKWKQNKKWKDGYEWKLTALKAATVIRAIQPYLLIKSKQAELVLKAQSLKGRYAGGKFRWHPELMEPHYAALEEIKRECAALNHRGKA
jgi:hypothetical protein